MYSTLWLLSLISGWRRAGFNSNSFRRPYTGRTSYETSLWIRFQALPRQWIWRPRIHFPHSRWIWMWVINYWNLMSYRNISRSADINSMFVYAANSGGVPSSNAFGAERPSPADAFPSTQDEDPKCDNASDVSNSVRIFAWSVLSSFLLWLGPGQTAVFEFGVRRPARISSAYAEKWLFMDSTLLVVSRALRVSSVFVIRVLFDHYCAWNLTSVCPVMRTYTWFEF